MTRRWFTELLLLPIPIILIPIRATTPAWGWLLEPDLFWEAHGPTTGEIAIGTTATSTLTTTIILTETPTEPSTGELLARETRGSTMRNIEEMRPMETDKPRISTVARLPEKVAHLELALAEAAVPECDLVVGLALALLDRVSAEATDRVAL